LRRIHGCIALAMLTAISARAVTYIVPSDRDLVRRADAIAIARAIESHAERNAAGGIVTITSFIADESIKGELSRFQLTEPGGTLDKQSMMIPGSPRFVDGTRYLLFLHRMPDGNLTTHALGLGKFDFMSDFGGRELLARGASSVASGWDESGAAFYEPLRDADAFLDFVRSVAKHPDAPVVQNYALPVPRTVAQLALKPAPNATRGDYLFETKPRWNNNATVAFSYCCAPTLQPLPFDGPAAGTAAALLWSSTGTVHYSLGNVSTANKGLTASDGTNGILFNDPNNELAAFGAGVVALGGLTNVGATYTLGSETFSTSVEADIVVGKGSQFPSFVTQSLFTAVVTHEMGHTLGFRHADGTGNPVSPPPACTSPLPCAFGGQAIMESVVSRTTLGQWDVDAATTVYGVCTNAAITAQPQNATITSGASTTLSVTATGTTPTYQWFTGTPGSGTVISGKTASTLTISPTTTTTYYVAVTACGTTINSNAATVTVNPASGPCGTSANELCLNDSRYRVTLTATDPGGRQAQGVPLKQSNLFGYFSLPALTGDSSNPEVFVKTVGPVGGVPWVFYAGLTNLDYVVNVTDTKGSFNQTYHVVPPPSGSFQSFGNFDVGGATSSNCANVTVTSGTAATGSCTQSTSTLCLLNRFAVTLQAKDNPSRSNNSGPGVTVPVNSVFGFFTTPALAPDPSDIQVFVKMVDAVGFNNRFWVFLGGLTDLDFTVTVVDTQKGVSKIYNKPAGSTCGWNDTQAFTP
jgi:hypothetical protein